MHWNKSRGILCVFLAAVLLFSAVMTGTLAWRSFAQHKTNEFRGYKLPSTPVVLFKYEKDLKGNLTEIPLAGVGFALFRVDGDEEIEYGLFTTDANGRVSVGYLLPGDYYFLETTPPYGYTYDSDANGDPIKKYPFTVSSDGNVSEPIVVKAYNKRLPADLVVKKTVENPDGSELTPEQEEVLYEFTVTFYNADDSIHEDVYQYSVVDDLAQQDIDVKSGDKIYLKHGQSAVIKNLPVGIKYEVLETTGDYQIRSTGNTGNLPLNGAEAHFINTAPEGQLIVVKETEGEPDPDLTYAFEAEIDGVVYAFTLKAGERKIFMGLRIGAPYVVTELYEESDPYRPIQERYVGVIPAAAPPVEVVIVNMPSGGEEGNLIIEKELKGDNIADEDRTVEFTFIVEIGDETPFEITLKHGETWSSDLYPVGTLYKITEKPKEGFVAAVREVSGQIVGQTTIPTVFDNRKEDGQLIVVKETEGELDPDLTYSFEAEIDGVVHSFTLKAGERKVFSGLRIGAPYVVTELYEESDPYRPIQEKYVGVIPATAPPVEVVIVNMPSDEEEGNLIIKKELKGDNITDEDRAVEFTFIVEIGDEAPFEITLKHGETWSSDLYPAGTLYKVTEQPKEGFTAAVREVSGQIVGITVVPTVFDNRKNSKLIVEKTVIGDGDHTKEFMLTVVVKDRDGAVLDGFPMTFYLKHGETKEIDLPLDAYSYEVSEKNYIGEGYALRPLDGGQGTIRPGGDVITVTAENEFLYVVIEGEKTWSFPEGFPLPTSIWVSVYDGDTRVARVEVKPDANGEWRYTFTLPKYNGTREIIYTIKEDPIRSFDSEVDEEYNIHNTYYPSSLPVVKKVIESESTRPDATFTFVLTPDDESYPMPAGSVNGKKTVVVAGEGTADFGEIRFMQAGTYIYTINEVQESLSGFVYDKSIYKLTVVVVEQDGWFVVESETLTKEDEVVESGVATFTNVYDGETETSIKVIKEWADQKYDDRPTEVTVQLYKNGQPHEDPVPLNDGNNWRHIWEGLEKGPTYHVQEVEVPDGYTVTYGGDAEFGFIVINSRCPEPRKTVVVTKIWDDGNYAGRPGSVRVQLYRDGVPEGNPFSLHDGNNWTYNWTDLDPDAEWTVSEIDVPEEYEQTTRKDVYGAVTILSVVNKYGGGKTSIDVEKVWDDGGYVDRPTEVKAQLYRNGVPYGDPVPLNEGNDWQHRWNNLEENPNWTVDEVEVPAGYSKTVTGRPSTGFTITNKRGGQPIKVSVKKAWVDDDYVDRPASVLVQLYENGNAYGQPVPLSAPDWEYTWEDLDSSSSWTVDEVNVPAGYSKTVTGDAENGFYIINSRCSTIDVSVLKIWIDDDYVDRPDSVEVQLYRDGEPYGNPVALRAEDDWQHIWTGLDPSHVWTVDEENVPDGYTKTVQGDAMDGFYIVNSRCEIEDTSVKVVKRWVDDGYAGRPDIVWVQLYQDGEPYGDAVELHDGNDWKHVWTDLETGHDWTVKEVDVPDGYVAAVVGCAKNGFVIINTRKTPTKLRVLKIWIGPAGTEHPDSVDVQLYKDGNPEGDAVKLTGPDWTHTWDDLDSDADWTVDEVDVPAGYRKTVAYDKHNRRFVVVNDICPPTSVRAVKKWMDGDAADRPTVVDVQLKRDGEVVDTRTLTGPEWTYVWDDLETGYTWTVDEADVPDGYTKTITSSLEGDVTVFTITNARGKSLQVVKAWEDDGSPDRPASVWVQLYKNGEADGESVELNDDNDWTKIWAGLDEDAVWTVDEVDVPDGYEKRIASDTAGDMTTVTSTNRIPAPELKVVKKWSDDGYAGRPSSIQVQLYKDGRAEGAAVTLKAVDDWTYTWTDLEIGPVWTVDEIDLPAGYTKHIISDTNGDVVTFTITNTRGPKSVTVHKAWEDDSNKDRPGSVKVQLLRNGEAVDSVTLNAGNNWTHYWDNLDRGSTWTVDEKDVPDGYKKTIATLENGEYAIFVVKNSRDVPASISVKKVWADDDYSGRPDRVSVHLKKNGEVVATETLSAPYWSHTWTNLEPGQTWTVDEDPVPDGYAKHISLNAKGEFTITNTRGPMSVKAVKAWAGDSAGVRPLGVVVRLIRNGSTVVEEVPLNASNNWTHIWNNLDKASTWTVDEAYIPAGYQKTVESSVNGVVTTFTITNTRFASVTVSKVWADDNYSGRPTEVQVRLLRNGVSYDIVKLSGSDWSYTWDDLEYGPTWTVREVSVPAGYTEYVADHGNGQFTITNSRGTKSVKVVKTWDDRNYSGRPTSVQVKLYRNDDVKETGPVITLYAGNNWTHTWTNLEQSATWTVKEVVPSGYTANLTTSVSGNVTNITIINKRSGGDGGGGGGGGGGTTSVSVTKVWNDGDYSGRPAEVKVQLYRNGSSYGSAVTLNAGNGWAYSWKNLATGSVWTVDEINAPSGYTKLITGSAGNGFVITNTRNTPPDEEDDSPNPPPLIDIDDPPETDVPGGGVPGAGPKTGDNGGLWLWILLMVASAFGLRFLLLGKPKSKGDGGKSWPFKNK